MIIGDQAPSLKLKYEEQRLLIFIENIKQTSKYIPQHRIL